MMLILKLCKSKQFITMILVILCALITSISTYEYTSDSDYENTLQNYYDTRKDIKHRCIPFPSELIEQEIEERGRVTKDSQTSFIPSYCKRNLMNEEEGEDELDAWRRVKRHDDLAHFSHIDNMHSLTPEEVRKVQASVMMRYMDTSVDPCTDFYSYACGNWHKFNPIPSDKVAFDTFEILRESLDQALHHLLMKDSAIRKHQKRHRNKMSRRNHSGPEKNAELKAMNLFQSCMNYELIEKRGTEPLLELLESLGGWPLLDPNWDEKSFDWLGLIANLRRYNNDILIVQYVGADIENSNQNVIQFDQTTLGLPTRDYFLEPVNEKYLNSYRNFMVTIINLLGIDAYEAEDRADEIIEFETNLAKIMSSQKDRTNISKIYQKISLEELHEEVPGIDWIRYLSIVQNRVVDSSEIVIMFAKNYSRQLIKLIEESEASTVANYILWRFVRHRINNLDNRFLEAKQIFYQECFGREKSPPRWKNCVSQVNSNMGMAVGALFVRKFFDEGSKMDILTMVRELQTSFREIINETEWIDVETRQLAGQKLDSMSLKIGYPDFILSRHKLDEKYMSLHIHPDKYFENTLNVLKYLNQEEQKKFNQPVNKMKWQTYPAIVNAFYSRSKNQIMFPAGILQPPFYHRSFPKSLNYGGIGVVIGHECTHGFDDKGRLFDKDGNLNKWWSDYAIRHFHDKTKCLIQQYNQYTVADIGQSIDGESTQGENIADGGGINQAFRAYVRWLNGQENVSILENETLPGLNLTNIQLFFLNFGQVWCGDIRREANKNKIKTAVHSPGRFRVIGALSNFAPFSKAFNCPRNSKMNPSRKCKVW